MGALHLALVVAWVLVLEWHRHKNKAHPFDITETVLNAGLTVAMIWLGLQLWDR